MRTLSLVVVSFMVSTALSAQKWIPANTEYFHHQPEIVTPGESCSDAPSDAIILFDGTNLDMWQSEDGGKAEWKIEDGALVVTAGKGVILTKGYYGDCQLHVEWSSPIPEEGQASQGRGNSGVFLQSKYEVQVLDNYDNKTYSNGQAGSIYKQTPPLVNVCRKPMEWQSYDILYRAPRFGVNGVLDEPARITVLHNGVVVQFNTEIKGTTEFIGWPKYEVHGLLPLKLQDHGNPVRYRNIWIREL